MKYHLIPVFLILSGCCCLNMQCNVIAAQSDSIQRTMIASEESWQILPQHWRLGLQNGLSYMWASTGTKASKLIADGANADDVDDFYKQFHRGYHFSADVYRIFASTWGIGIKYSIMASTAEQYIQFDTGDGLNLLNTNIINREYVNFIGASFFIQQRFEKAKALRLNSSIALGYARYRNEFETDFGNYYFNTNTLATGNTIGGSWDISLEYFPIPMVSVVIGAGCFLARFDRLYTSNGRLSGTVDLTGDDRRNVSRFDFFIGVRAYLK